MRELAHRKLPDNNYSDDSVKIIANLAQSRDWQIRNISSYLLGTTGSRAFDHIDILVKNCRDNREPVRVNAATALAGLGMEAEPYIRELLLDNDKVVRLTMGMAMLGKAGGVPEHLKDAVSWAAPPIALRGTNLHPDSSFEAYSDKLFGWDVQFIDGAAGYYEICSKRSCSGRQSLKLVKTNAEGYIKLVSKEYVNLSAGTDKWTYRARFQAFDATTNSVLLLRLQNENGELLEDDVNGGCGRQSQSMLRNTPENFWDSRAIIVRQKEHNIKVKPAVIYLGDPGTVYLDDLDFPAVKQKIAEAGPTRQEPHLSYEQAMKIISKRPAANIRLISENGKTRLLLNGEQCIPHFYVPARGVSDAGVFANAGKFKFPMVSFRFDGQAHYPPFTDWSEGTKPDFKLWFDEIEELLKTSPDCYPLICIKVPPMKNFAELYPDELWRDSRNLPAIGSKTHMFTFSNKLSGNCDRFWPSQFSDKAYAYSHQIFREFLTELKKKPYAHIIAGTLIGGGHDAQFMIYCNDFSLPALREWRKFLRERYKTDAALAEAWNKPDAKIDSAEVPPDLKPERDNLMFYNPATAMPGVDYRRFRERQIWKNSEAFARDFKEIMGKNKLALTWCMDGGWHKDFDYFLKSEYLDGFGAQPNYQFRTPGHSGGLVYPDSSINLHGKLAIAELDTRCWGRGIYNEVYTQWVGTPLDRKHFVNSVYKELGTQIAKHQGYWFFDICNGTYRQKDAMELIARSSEIAGKVFQKAALDRFVPGAALIFHRDSIFFESPRNMWSTANLPALLVNEMAHAMRISGVPFTGYFLDDVMKNPALIDRHKVLIFPQSFMLNDQERKFISSLKNKKRTLVWIYAPGIINEKNISLRGIEEITGISVDSDPAKVEHIKVRYVKSADPLAHDLPPIGGTAETFRHWYSLSKNESVHKRFAQRFDITDKNVSVLGRYAANGKTATAVKRFPEWSSIYCAAPGGLDAQLLFNIAKENGIYCAADRPGLICDVNDFFMNIHAQKGGKYRINLPLKSTVKDAITGKTVAVNAESFICDIEAQQTKWFLLER